MSCYIPKGGGADGNGNMIAPIGTPNVPLTGNASVGESDPTPASQNQQVPEPDQSGGIQRRLAEA